MNRRETQELAVELYLVPPADFVTARNEVARQAHAAGDRELAGELRGLRRPKLSAWLVNLLVRHERMSMDRLVAVGRELREAQTQLDTIRLRQLAGERQQLIAELLDRAKHRAVEVGVRPSPAVVSEVEATLKAALVDLAASSMVLSGRLVRPMSHSGFGPMPWVSASAPPRLSASPAPGGVPEFEDSTDNASVLDLFAIDFPVLDELAQRRARASSSDGPGQEAERPSQHIEPERPSPDTAPDTAPERPSPGSGPEWPAPSPGSGWAAADRGDGRVSQEAGRDDGDDPERALGWPHEEARPVRIADAREVKAATAELAAAESRHWQREFELADAEGAVDAARDRCETLDTQRFQARRDRATAERHLAEAQAAQQDAVRAVEKARRALEAAERRQQSDD